MRRTSQLSFFVVSRVMHRTLLICFSLCFGFIAHAQKARVSGVVSDENGATIPGCYVRLLENPRVVTLTNEQGEYTIDLDAGNVVLVFSFVGKKNREESFRLAPGASVERNVTLVRSTNLETVEVIGDNTRGKPLQRIDPKVANRIPSPRGTVEDLLLQAPVNFTSELSSSYSVRGGSFDENLVYVNDIQVYRPFLVRAGQQEGLSFPNADMVDNIFFSAGGFESKYGDRMSSVLDITYRRPSEFRGTMTASMLGLSFQVEDVNKKGTFTHNTGIRYRDNSYVLGTLDEQGDYNPRYFDVQTFLTWKPEPFGMWTYSFLGNISQNRYNFVPQTRETDVGTINEALRLTIFFDGQEETGFETYFGALSAERATDRGRLRFIGSAFQTFEYETFDILGQYFLDELERDLGSDSFGEVLRNRGVGSFLNHARNDLEAYVLNFTHTGLQTIGNDEHVLEWGVRLQQERVQDILSEWTYLDSAGYGIPRQPDSIGYTVPQLQPERNIVFDDVIRARNDVSSSRVTGFIQNTWRSVSEKGEWNFNAGVRGNYWSFNNQFVGGPRANLSFTPRWYDEEASTTDTLRRRDIVFSIAGGYYWQPAFYREMRRFDGSVNEEIRAQRAIHLVAGMDYLFEKWGRPFKLTTEIYYKDLSSLIPYEVENVRLRYYATNNARGFATGADVMLNGEFISGIQSWMRLSVLRTAEDLNDDFYYDFFNDEGNLIIPGFTLNSTAVDSVLVEPGFIPRPTDQRVNLSMLFQDEMPRWPEYKVLVSIFYGTGLPFGPPTADRYLQTLRTSAYRRVDIGFSRDLFTRNSGDRKRMKWAREGYVSLEVFNVLGVNNTINHTWIRDVSGRVYAIPNFLTGRRINLKFSMSF
jgi:hypothetical protein